MLRKDIFLKYSNDKVKQNVRGLLHPYPELKEIEKKVQTVADWKYFKNKHMKELYSNLRKENNSSRSNLKI